MKRTAKAVLGATIFYLSATASVWATVVEPSAHAIANPDTGTARAQDFPEAISGVRFLSTGGYQLKLSQSEDGMLLEIAGADGAAKQMSFSFYDDQSGAVFTEDHTAVGRFWITKNEIYIRYRDGWSEALWPSAGNLQMVRKSPDGHLHYTTWYSRDHSPAVSTPIITVSSKSDATKIAAPLKAVKVALVAHSTAPLQAITVRTSVIHTIDQPIVANPVVVGSTAIAMPQPFQLPAQQASVQPSAVPNPSKCLSVESNGAHWGFRNRCDFDIQFAYCVASGADQLTSCKDGAVTGSVAPHGFGALTTDKSIGDSADHDFRWIACDGGAGEVVPHMDRSDPPMGRCLRSNAS